MGSSQVARRPTYKGIALTAVHMPMDSATVIGVVAIFGCILPATGLKAEGVRSCQAVFDALADLIDLNEPLCLIPEIPQMTLPIENNKVKVRSLMSMLKKMELKPDRTFHNDCFA